MVSQDLKQVTVYIDRDFVQQFDEVAKKKMINRSSLIRMAMQQMIES